MNNLKKKFKISLLYFLIIVSLIFCRIYSSAFHIVTHYNKVNRISTVFESIIPKINSEKHSENDKIFDLILVSFIIIFHAAFKTYFLKYRPLLLALIFLRKRRGPPFNYFFRNVYAL